MSDRRRSAPLSARAFLYLYGASVAGLCLLGLAFGQLGHEARVDEPTDLDNFVHDWVVRHRHDWPALTSAFHVATLFGNPDVATLATAVITFGLYVLHRKGLAGVRKAEPFVWLGAILGGRLLSIGLKLFYQRERPPVLNRMVSETTYSFPSGHSVFAAVFFSMLAYVLARMIPATHAWLRLVSVALCVVMAVVVAASRVWLGVHYPTDVLGGLLLGICWVFTVWLVRVGWDHWRWRDPTLGDA
jgi:undecaprenyl-diphosphatase